MSYLPSCTLVFSTIKYRTKRYEVDVWVANTLSSSCTSYRFRALKERHVSSMSTDDFYFDKLQNDDIWSVTKISNNNRTEI